MNTHRLKIPYPRSVLLSVAACALISVPVANAATYSQAVLTDNPVGYWRLEELTGEQVADSGTSGAFAGTYTGLPALGLPGIDVSSIRLPGPSTTSPVIIGYYPELNPTAGSGAFSVEIWVRPNSNDPTDWRCPIGNFGGWGAVSGWYIYQSPGAGSTFTFVLQPSGWVGGGTYEMYRWYHLVGTYDGATARFYVDGVLKGSQPLVFGTDFKANETGTMPLCLGARDTGYGWWDGNLDEAAIYSVALTPEQVMAHYTVGTNSFYTPPQAPTFALHPASTTSYAGTLVKFSAKADGFPTAMSYQWYKDSAAIPDATNATYTFTCALADDQKTFKVTADNGVNPPATSSDATLTVLTNLEVYVQPTSVTRTEGAHSKAAFLTLARGAQPLTYQWYKGTTQIPGATSPTLWVSGLSVAADDGSTYSCRVTTPYGIADSVTAVLTVQARTVDVPITKHAKVIMADDPVGYWRLDEPDGSTAATDVVGSFDAAYTPGVGAITYAVPTGIPGESDTAVIVTNGATVRIPYALELNPFGPFSVECWLQPSRQALDGNDYRTPISSQRSGDGPVGWHVYLLPQEQFAWVLWGGHWANWWVNAAMPPVVANNWYHLTLTYDGATFVIYVNGVASGSAPDPGFVQVGNRPAGDNPGPYPYTYDGAGETVFGWRADADWKPYPGGIDDVAIYNKALTAEQVKLHYASSVRLTIAQATGNNVVVSWPFGTLQCAPAVTGTYTNIPNATSPLTNAVSGVASFYRVQVQ